MNDEVFSRLIAPVTRGIRLLFGRGVLTGTHDELKMQNVQLTGMDGETFDDVERPQQYGQISVPLPGAETFLPVWADSGIRLWCLWWKTGAAVRPDSKPEIRGCITMRGTGYG